MEIPERISRGGRSRVGIMDSMTRSREDSHPTRSSLLRRVKDTGDQPSWQQFNDIYGKLILGFALKAGLTEDEAAEVVQETLISAAKHLPEFRYNPKLCSFKTWLLNLSNWRVKDQIRKRQVPSAPGQRAGRAHSEKQDRTSTATAERVADPAGSQLEALWDKEWHTTLLEAACRRIKTQVELKQWQIFDLYVLKEWQVRDVAQALGVSAGRVYLAKHRVSTLIKKELKRLEKA
jgi:RNA polymerase sigma factor (sigma-70 family)